MWETRLLLLRTCELRYISSSSFTDDDDHLFNFQDRNPVRISWPHSNLLYLQAGAAAHCPPPIMSSICHLLCSSTRVCHWVGHCSIQIVSICCSAHQLFLLIWVNNCCHLKFKITDYHFHWWVLKAVFPWFWGHYILKLTT